MSIKMDKKKIPIPEPMSGTNWKRKGRAPGKRVVYPFEKMKIGQSFTAPKTAAQAARKYALRNEGYKFVTRVISPTRVRVWRVKAK